MTAMTAPQPQTPPPARQCLETNSHLFGAVAVYSERFARWGVMTPENGGHWADAAEVDGWAELVAKPAPAPAAPAAAPPSAAPAK